MLQQLAVAFILNLCLCAHANVFFSTNFEERNPLETWEVASPGPGQEWMSVSNEYAASGGHGMRIAAGNRHIITKRVLLPLNAAELRAGLYFTVDFRIEKDGITADTGADIWCTIISFVMSGNRSVSYGNPTLLLEKRGPDIFLKMLVRQKRGDRPVTIPPDPVLCVVPGMWHSVSVSISVKDYVLMDSLWCDSRFIGAGTRTLIDVPAMIEKIELGAGQGKKTPVSFICFDNVTMSEKRLSNTIPADQITVRQRPGKGGFHVGDTLFLDLAFTPFGRKDYIDLNLRSSSFGASLENRFGLFNRKRNLVFSLYDSIGVPFKGDEGLNAWKYASVGDTVQGAYPHNTFLFDKYRFYPDRGSGTVAIRVTDDFEPGKWEIHSCIVRSSDTVIVQNMPVLHFTIERKFSFMVLLGCGIALLVIFGIIFFRLVVRSREQEPLQGNSKEIADKIDQLLATEYSNADLSNEDIARVVYLSVSHATALYKEARTISPMQRLRDIRMEKACEMLEKTDKAISDIGFEVGFNNQNIFFRNFKKYKGLSPTEYQKQKKAV